MRNAHFIDLKQALINNHRNTLSGYPKDYKEVAGKAIDDCIATIGNYLEERKAAKQK